MKLTQLRHCTYQAVQWVPNDYVFDEFGAINLVVGDYLDRHQPVVEIRISRELLRIFVDTYHDRFGTHQYSGDGITWRFPNWFGHRPVTRVFIPYAPVPRYYRFIYGHDE